MTLRWPRHVLRTLRGRLLVVLLAVSVIGLLAMGVANVGLLHHSLISRIDERLVGMSRPWAEGNNPPPLPPDVRGPRGLPTDFRVVFFDPLGNPTAMVGQTETDPSGPVLVRHPVSQRPFTVPDRAGGPGWRVRTVITPGGDMIALALSLGTTDATVRELIVIELAVGAVVLIVLATVATVTVRLGLRPLNRIEHTAHAIATGDLERRIADQDPATETGRLGAALNTMLGRLVAALQQREQSEHRHFARVVTTVVKDER